MTFSSFQIGGPLTELIQLANAAVLIGEPFEYDTLTGQIPGLPDEPLRGHGEAQRGLEVLLLILDAGALEERFRLPKQVLHLQHVHGQNFRYRLRYTNIGGQTAAGVTLTDTLPAGTEYVSDTGSGAANGDQVVWDLGDVDLCAYQTITLTARLSATASTRGQLRRAPSPPCPPGNASGARWPAGRPVPPAPR